MIVTRKCAYIFFDKSDIHICIWVFSEMSFPRFDRLVLSDGGPLLIQYISDACVSSRQNDKQFFLYLKTHQRRLRGALLSWRYIGTWGWTVWGKWRKGKKSSCSEKSSSEKSTCWESKNQQRTCGCAWARGGSGRPSLREACARFCPWFAKIICSPVSGTCLAEQSKPCANLAQTLRCLAVLLHLVGGPLLKENVKLANGTQMSRWSFFACYTFLESAHIYIYIFVILCVCLWFIYMCVSKNMGVSPKMGGENNGKRF